MHIWLDEVAGLRWPFDTYGGKPDITLLSLPSKCPTHRIHLRDALRKREAGALKPETIDTVFLEYDGALGRLAYTGIAGERNEVAPVGEHYEPTAGVAAPELAHVFGAVPSWRSQRQRIRHATDHDRDILAEGSLVDGLLDCNRDDYFGHGREDSTDTATAPYWEAR